jgi:CheY-like chemotaxis protein
MIHVLRRNLDAYDIIPVRDREQLPHLIERHQPVALIVDVWEQSDTPDFAELRALLPDDLPLVRFTLQGTLRRAQSLGVNEYLIKPVTRTRLLDAISRSGENVAKILIADDDPNLVDLVGRMIESANRSYTTIKTFGGEDALHRMRQEKPDLILLDLRMPGVSGLDVLAQMQADPNIANIPVIVLSAHEYLELEPNTCRGSNLLSVTRGDNFSTEETLHFLKAQLNAFLPRLPEPLEPASVLPAEPLGAPAS